jgi:uncharacterized protein (TIGR02466 family)
MTVKAWFPTLTYDEELKPTDQVRQGMLDYVDAFYERNKEQNIGSANITGDVTGDYQIAKEPAFNWLNKQVAHHCKNYLKEFGVNSDNLNLFSSKSWAVVCGHTIDTSDAKYAVEKHNHPNSHLSVVFYLQTDDYQGGELELDAPSTHPIWYVPLAPHVEELPYPSLTSISFLPTINQIVIFPSSVTHCVKPYYGSGKRYSITYDILITGKKDLDMNNEMCVVHPNNWININA